MSIYKRFISHLLILCTILSVLSSAVDASMIDNLTGQERNQNKVKMVNAENAAPDLADTSLGGEADIGSALVKPLITYGGHTYTLFDGTASSWDMAKEYCESLDGHLATITSAEENAFLYNYMRNCGYSNAYWGLTDYAVEGIWEWCTGEPVTYTNWASGEPNDDYGSTEDYGMFWDEKPDGYWNDGVFGHDGQAFLCEWDCVLPEAANVYNGHVYLLVDTDVSSWEDAQAYCESLGGHLATITSAEENAFIYSYIVECGHRNAYFGLTDQNSEGTWEWCNGEPVSYTNWPQDQPSDNVGEENYGMYWDHYTNGEWNDGSFTNSHPFICEWDTIHNTHNTHDTINQLTELDYLAMSKVSYWDFDAHTTKTLKQALIDMGYWDKNFESTGVKVSELCASIGHWTVADVDNYSNDNGFYGVTFASGDDAVIAYRGSFPLNGLEDLKTKDAIYDWVLNDLYPIVLDRIFDRNQYQNAITMYEDNAKIYSNIAVTGHSLGGGLADMISAHYGCKGVSMNAISILDAFYTRMPKHFGASFTGVDEWNFMDHANQFDLLAGAFEIATAPLGGTKIKPVTTHKSNRSFSYLDLIYYHGLGSYVSRNGNGVADMNDRVGFFRPNSVISNNMLTTGISIDFGTSRNDIISKGLSVAAARTSYGGKGCDTISTNIWSDTLIGGKDYDELDGSWGNDTYEYYKDDGVDTIRDVGGDDKLVLLGFEDDDTFSVLEDYGDDYIHVRSGGDTIVKISKKNREYSLFTTNSFKIVVASGADYSESDVYDITDAFYKYTYGEHIYIGCPVHVEIVDANGTIVHTLIDGEVGSWYTDYGNFYVFEEENGEYGKVLDLIEGYTARIVGAGEGTMDVTYQVPVEGELTEPVSVSNVPVTENLVATIEEDEEGDVYLLIDEDGDGETDSEQKLYGECPFTDVPEDSFYYTPVLWAVDEGITTGATETTFNPNGQCQRAQVVTFLWRAAGCPEPVTAVNPFMDVKESDFYYKAVLWAVENGITNGLDATHFGPFAYCNRAQVVTFLYRGMEQPEVSTTECPFADVEAGAWYERPVLWAVENNVTNGMDATTFGVNTTCNRAQVVTFLYRAFEQ